jgi:DNA-binding transcriptional regulator YhcF (GntR family)
MHVNNIKVDRSLQISIECQFYAQLLLLMKTGTIKKGERMPRVSHLVEQTGVNANTIKAAYRSLTRDGLVVARKGVPLTANYQPRDFEVWNLSGAEAPTKEVLLNSIGLYLLGSHDGQ